ncbi:spore maturation protein SpmB [Sporomusaceae bacterium BoRhaA]|uniref:YjiG family protein n=1 Tax=Pelorhabdus rhamnosifermentans TaxID=2772457 RepID=UPI001C06066D|nr:YjiG family protein [Pelorhabdus rhamnosifermentans]MBU2699452.1 spore maturation protein SpmB [Pelorhabdus rhamnosifermentans]
MGRMNVVEMFVEGARKGWDIAIKGLMPNVIFAFTLIKILQVTGAMSFIGNICEPVMGLWGLPGQAIMVTVTALMSQGGAVGVLASLLSDGVVNTKDATILLPVIFAAGGQLQNLGRVLGTSGVKTKYYGLLFGMTIVNGILAMTIMSFFAKTF